MSEEARLEKKQRVEENRERRLQDALNRAIEEANMDEESENNYDEAPAGPQMSVRQYLKAEETVQNQQHASHSTAAKHVPPAEEHTRQYAYRKDDKVMSFYQDGPPEHGPGYPSNDLLVV